LKISEQERTAGKPQLTPERVGGAEVFVGTVKGVAKQYSKQKGDDQYVVEFEEVDDAVFRLNVTNLNLLCDELGDDTDKWIGQKVPLVKTRETVRNKPGTTFVVYQVAPRADWRELLGDAPRRKGKR